MQVMEHDQPQIIHDYVSRYRLTMTNKTSCTIDPLSIQLEHGHAFWFVISFSQRGAQGYLSKEERIPLTTPPYHNNKFLPENFPYNSQLRTALESNLNKSMLIIKQRVHLQ